MKSLYQEVVKSPRDDLYQKLEIGSMPRDVFFDIYGVNAHIGREVDIYGVNAHIGREMAADWFFDPIISINDHIENELWNCL